MPSLAKHTQVGKGIIMSAEVLNLSEFDKSLVRKLTGPILKNDVGFNFDDADFLKNLPIVSSQLPERIISFLNEFKYNPPEEGYCIVSTGEIDTKTLGQTPGHWDLTTNNDTCSDAVMAMCLCATILGDIFGWQTQQDGRVIHDILPIKKYEDDQLGCGSREELTWHTEDAFHELRGDYLIMMCLRNNDQIPTTLCKPDYSQLSKQHIDELFKKQFVIKPDNSHKAVNASRDRFAALDKESIGLSRAYESMMKRDSKPQEISVLFGNRNDPCLRIDPYFMEQPKTLEAQEALAAMVDLVSSSLVEVALNPGDILVVDNYEVVHGRRPFKARYDGQDRWYKRINVIRDIRRCNEVLETKLSRVIY